jgi:hypothetical protein
VRIADLQRPSDDGESDVAILETLRRAVQVRDFDARRHENGSAVLALGARRRVAGREPPRGQDPDLSAHGFDRERVRVLLDEPAVDERGKERSMLGRLLGDQAISGINGSTTKVSVKATVDSLPSGSVALRDQ